MKIHVLLLFSAQTTPNPTWASSPCYAPFSIHAEMGCAYLVRAGFNYCEAISECWRYEADLYSSETEGDTAKFINYIQTVHSGKIWMIVGVKPAIHCLAMHEQACMSNFHDCVYGRSKKSSKM